MSHFRAVAVSLLVVVLCFAGVPLNAKGCPAVVPAGEYGQPGPASNFQITVTPDGTTVAGNGLCNNGFIPGPITLEKVTGHCRFDVPGTYTTCAAIRPSEGELCNTENVRYVGTYEEKTGTLTLVIVHADGSITGPEIFTAGVVNPPPLCG
jgi:hypothetical protein